MKLPKKRHFKLWVGAVILLAVCVGLAIILLSSRTAAPKSHTTPKPHPAHSQSHLQPTAPPTPPVISTVQPPSFNKQLYSTSNPASLWVIVNKQHPLQPINYVPSDLTMVGNVSVSAKIAPSLTALILGAKNEGYSLRVISGYRSFSYQTNLYSSYVASDGQAKADTYSARPGYSEHQTGLAVDLGGAHGCDVEQCFSTTPEGQWLAAHASDYGFIVRYTAANQSITGYEAEAWHLRYVGPQLASEMRKQNIDSLEHFFGISGGSIYR